MKEQGGEKMNENTIEETVGTLKGNIAEIEENIAADERLGGKRSPEQTEALLERQEKLKKLKAELLGMTEGIEDAIDKL